MDDTRQKCWKLLFRTAQLINEMEGTKDILIHRHINQFYYMQKNAELKLLIDMLDEPAVDRSAVTAFIERKYREVFRMWRDDLRWLSNYRKDEVV